MAYYKKSENDIQDLHREIENIQKHLKNSESKMLLIEKDIAIINKQLDKINASITWILRVIISAVLTGLLSIFWNTLN